MTKEQHRAYLRSPEWQERSRACLKRDEYTCQCCGAKGVPLRARSTKGRVEASEGADLITLCDPCYRLGKKVERVEARPSYARRRQPAPSIPAPPQPAAQPVPQPVADRQFKDWLRQQHPDLARRKRAIQAALEDGAVYDATPKRARSASSPSASTRA